MIATFGGVASGADRRRPARLVDVDLDDAGTLPDRLAELAGSYREAWLVLHRGTRPEALVRWPLTDPPGDAGELVDPLRRLGTPASGPAPAPERAPVSGLPPAEPPPVDDLPHITVVVPTNMARPDELQRCVGALRTLDYPRYDIVVVDNRGPGSGEPVDLPCDPRLRTVRQTVPGISAARNAGLAVARGEVVAFTDDDVVVDPRWLRELGSRYAAQPELGCVTGMILPAELETDAQLWFEEFYGGFGAERRFDPLTFRLLPPLDGRTRPVVEELDRHGDRRRTFSLFGAGAIGAGANLSFRRELLLSLGGFDERLGAGTPARGGEDLLAVTRLLWAGIPVGYQPAAVVRHRHRTDYGGLRRQLFGYGLGFSACLTALQATHPALLSGLARQLPSALVVRAKEFAGRLGTASSGTPGSPAPRDEPSPAPGYPRELVWAEATGLFLGPLMFSRSALRRRPSHATSHAGR